MGLKLLDRHSWSLVNNNNTQLVSKIHQLFRIWIMGGPVGICTSPLDKVVIFDQHCIVQTFASNLENNKRARYKVTFMR